VGRRRLADPFTLDRLTKEVSHNTGLQQATAEIVLRYMVLAIEGAIKDGRSVELGDLGTLSPTISIIAADDSADVKIRKKRILFRPSKKLREIVNTMSIRFIGEDDDDEDTTDGEGSGTTLTDDQGGGTGDNTLQP